MKQEIDLIFVACMTSVVIIVAFTAIGLVTNNEGWYKAAMGPWTVLVSTFIAGAARTLRRRE